MLALAGREQGDHGRKKDPMGPWTLAERGGNTFERLSVLFCFLVFFRFRLQPSPFRPCVSAVVETLRRRGWGQRRRDWMRLQHWSGHWLMNAIGVYEMANQNEWQCKTLHCQERRDVETWNTS